MEWYDLWLGLLILSVIICIVFAALGGKNEYYYIISGMAGATAFIFGVFAAMASKSNDVPRSKNDYHNEEDILISKLKIDKDIDEHHLQTYIQNLEKYQDELTQRVKALDEHKNHIQNIADQEYTVFTNKKAYTEGRNRSNANADLGPELIKLDNLTQI